MTLQNSTLRLASAGGNHGVQADGRNDGAPAAYTHIQRAIAGHLVDQTWLVSYFSPYLLALARRHRALCMRLGQEPEDLVQEVWAVLFTKLTAGTYVCPPEERAAPALMLWLSTTLGHVINNRRRKGRARPVDRGGSSDSSPAGYWERLPAQTSGIVTKVLREEREQRLHDALGALSERDREVVLLRGLGQVSNRDVAALVGLEPKAVVARYRRALARLRSQLPDSLFGMLLAEEGSDGKSRS